MKTLTLTTAAVLLSGTSAFAQMSLNGVVSFLESEGYTSVEIDREDGTITIEGKVGNRERELVYHASTGTLLSDEIYEDDDLIADLHDDDDEDDDA